MEGGADVASIGSVLISSGGLELVKYSERSVAVFGDTKRVKDQLKAAGGKYNSALKRGSSSTPGWIFPLSQKTAVLALMGSPTVGSPEAVSIKAEREESKTLEGDAFVAEVSSAETGALLPDSGAASVGSVLISSGGLELVKYSERSVAVFGDTKRVKDQLKAAGGKYNSALKRGSSSTPGWIFPLCQQSKLANLMEARFEDKSDVSTVISGKKRKERELGTYKCEDEWSTDEFSN